MAGLEWIVAVVTGSVARGVASGLTVMAMLAGLSGCDGDSQSGSDNDGKVISYGLVVEDLNNDDRPDIVTANTAFTGPPNSGSVKVILQDADADFGTFEEGVFYEMGADTVDVGVGDLNLDGKPDVLSTSSFSRELSYRLQLSAGDGTLGDELLLDTAPRPGAMVVADINGDTYNDIIVSGESVWFWLYDRADPDDPDDEDEFRFGGTLNVRGQALAVARLNDDTQLDIVVGTPTGEVSVLLQAPESLDSFTPVFLPATDYDVDDKVFDVDIEDLDQDGRLDIAAVTARSIAVLLQELAPLGSGEFRDAVTYPIVDNDRLGKNGRQLVIAEIDDDNLLDLAATNYLVSGGGISIWLQEDRVGVGARFSQGPYIRATYPWGLGVADFNRDNLLDFAFANVNGASIVLQDWRNPGEFLPPDPDTNPVGGDNNSEE